MAVSNLMLVLVSIVLLKPYIDMLAFLHQFDEGCKKFVSEKR